MPKATHIDSRESGANLFAIHANGATTQLWRSHWRCQRCQCYPCSRQASGTDFSHKAWESPFKAGTHNKGPRKQRTYICLLWAHERKPMSLVPSRDVTGVQEFSLKLNYLVPSPSFRCSCWVVLVIFVRAMFSCSFRLFALSTFTLPVYVVCFIYGAYPPPASIIKGQIPFQPSVPLKLVCSSSLFVLTVLADLSLPPLMW